MKKLSCVMAFMMLLTGLTACAAPGLSQANDADAVILTALNIGKADCMLLRFGDQAFLIDAGYEQTYAALKTMLEKYHISHLNGVFLTHCHKDHAGGLSALAQSDVQVDSWYAPSIYYDVKPGQHPLQTAAASRGAKVTWLSAGDIVPAGPDAGFSVLGPLTVHETNENNNSLVMRFYSPQGSILLTGDMKEDEEYDLLSAGAFSACDVIKVGHHGDNKATSLNLLRIVQPKAALILTSSQEEIDTPAQSTLTRLRAAGAQVYVSQDAHDAWQVTLKGGVPAVEDVKWENVPERTENIVLSMDVANDTLTIENRGEEEAALSGCVLYSSRGEDSVTLPDFTLSPGETFTVGSRSTKGTVDFKWDVKRVWHQKKRDMAVLYDAYGRALGRTDNGFAE